MLLVHQTGTVKVGEVVRYTLTYTPSLDRILPTPRLLHVRIKNTTAIALRAAYLHGPYTLHVAAYPASFNPNRRVESPADDGVPEFEPQLKAGGSWDATLHVPESLRETAETDWATQTTTAMSSRSVTWVIEITSQVIFSNSATVHYELLVGRDENSLSLGFPALGTSGQASAGKVEDHQQGKERKQGHHAAQPKGIFSKAAHLVVDDTASLWDRPPWPAMPEMPERRREIKLESPHELKEEASENMEHSGRPDSKGHHKGESWDSIKPKRVHLVILTHGLHSNLGADLLYLKESIDATAREAREEAKRRRQRQRGHQESPGSALQGDQGQHSENDASTRPKDHVGQGVDREVENEDDDEEIIVRGFAENVIRTERGIKYLGKRLAKYVLRMTYPQQPYLPMKIPGVKSSNTPSELPSADVIRHGHQPHPHSSLYEQDTSGKRLPYKITSISFIGHSLGGLVQTYAIAYIQKHSPQFFEIIEPINFVALSTPFLGLSHENPMYVKFALDFGLVGRTGQDLGLAWSPPNIARSGWSALIGGLGTGAQKAKQAQHDPSSKPLLRILPTGPAHKALQMFRNRTVYANVVNDGIVPLRTSCLLFLDWGSLGRVEKARREIGLVGTMAEWGWAEITGSNVTTHYRSVSREMDSMEPGSGAAASAKKAVQVPEPSPNAAKDQPPATVPGEPAPHQFLTERAAQRDSKAEAATASPEPLNALTSFLTTLFPNREKNHQQPTTKDSKVYKRGQTVQAHMTAADGERSSPSEESRGVPDVHPIGTPPQSSDHRSSSMDGQGSMVTPPRTSFFESAGALLNPPLPPTEFLVDPSSRPRTIFHDRVYHPSDIPPPPVKRPSSFARSWSGVGDGNKSHRRQASNEPRKDHTDSGTMTVEEKIARAYHRDMSWRKVLVRLEPDAHNNIIVRRMFANAYGWPVVKHLVDTHFSKAEVATVRDDEQPGREQAKDMDQGVGEHGEEVEFQALVRSPTDQSATAEGRDTLGELGSGAPSASNSTSRPRVARVDSVQWSEADFEVTDDDDDDDDGRPHGGAAAASHARFSAHAHHPAAASIHQASGGGGGGSGGAPIKHTTTHSIEPDVFAPSGAADGTTHLGLRRSSLEQAREDGVMERVIKLASSPDHT